MMGGLTRKPVPRPKPSKPRKESPRPKNVLLPWQIDEAAFGSKKPIKNPKTK